MKPVSKLHFITTDAATAEEACKGGIDWIQLRLKNIPYADYYTIAGEVKAVCKEYNAAFIINDNVALALDIGADGVHIGKQDMLPDKARALIGAKFIIGCTANTLEDIVSLSGMPIDYIGLGPYRFTKTKQNLSTVLGLEGYQKIFAQLEERQTVPPPVIGIGGITENRGLLLMPGT
jgi:thiamine-phosphate pyrophosphorylase